MPTAAQEDPRLMPVIATVPLAAAAVFLAWTLIRSWVLPHLGDDVADLFLIGTGLAISPVAFFIVRGLRGRRRSRHMRGSAVTTFIEDRGRAYLNSRQERRERPATRR
jgi:hypothetical protein